LEFGIPRIIRYAKRKKQREGGVLGMRLLTEHERTALIEVDYNDGRSVPDLVFTELSLLGYGYWGIDEEGPVWFVTAKGRFALHLDTIAKRFS
jgi:hypothetical protein